MPIQSADIKLLNSQVMTDEDDGGGAMTGSVVVDGLDNNLFPDTSQVDRAKGRVNIRQVYGVAHTSDTDTLQGVHALITDAPDDPLVHCVLMAAPKWGARRTDYREVIERYLVKGPRLSARLYDAHYASAMQVRLVTFVGAAFPIAGDGIVLRTPAGIEQYVRILRVAISTENVAVVEGGGTLVLSATIAVCELSKELEHDFIGPPPSRIGTETGFAQVFSTSVAAGAKFYGIKPLLLDAAPGDATITLAGGIFTPIVPAATSETPIIDQFPLVGRAALARTALSAVTLPAVSMALGPNTVVQAPTAIEPGSASLSGAGVAFTDDGRGNLMQGALTVAAVDYQAGRITFAPGAPAYGSGPATLSYKPASVVGASNRSVSFAVTQANQGLAYTNVFEPPPAPGSFTLAYMAQGRWYELLDNMAGKLEGADSLYGVGSLNYASGSMAVTLGAIPDVGSKLIADWGDANAAKPVSTVLPTRLSARISLPARTKASGIVATWSVGATSYTATTSAAGVLTGDATGCYAAGVLTFAPGVLPSTDVTVTTQQAPLSLNSWVGGAGTYNLNGGTLPITPGTLRATVLADFPDNARHPVQTFAVWDNGGGVVYLTYAPPDGGGASYAVGTIDYSTGRVVMQSSATIKMVVELVATGAGWAAGLSHVYPSTVMQAVPLSGFTGVSYAGGAETTEVTTAAITSWSMDVDTLRDPLVLRDTAFTLGGDVYTAAAGVLRRGWDIATGAPQTASAGVVLSGGQITVTTLPASGTNAVVWHNAAVDSAPKLVSHGVFRTASAPLKSGVFQLQSGGLVGQANDGGAISGDGWSGQADFQRGIVTWKFAPGGLGGVGIGLEPASISYNAVLIQYMPLDAALLGLETARLPLDGKVPIYRQGDMVVVHNTQTLALPNPLTKGTTYPLGRQRLASVAVKTATGAKVDDTLYTPAMDLGELVFPVGSDLTGLAQPFTVQHTVQDLVVASEVDISGRIKLQRPLTHTYDAGTSYASGALLAGDVFGRVFNVFDQATWTGVWSDTRIGDDTLASYNSIDHPITTTNRGAVTERWALIFTSNTAFRIVGEQYGQLPVGGDINTVTAPINTATGVPFLVIQPQGWGGGWPVGSVLRINTEACGTALGAVRTVLQGPDTLKSDKFALAFRGDVNA